MKKNLMMNAIVGMGFGFPTTLLCMILFGGFNEVLREFLIWMVASALYGLLSGIIFHEKSELSLPAAVGLHGFGCIAITMGAALLCGYATDVTDVFPILIPAVVIYVVIYCICFFMIKQNEKRINQALREE